MLYLRRFLYFRELYLRSDVIVICESIILRKLKGNSASLVKKRKNGRNPRVFQMCKQGQYTLWYM